MSEELRNKLKDIVDKTNALKHLHGDKENTFII